MSNIRASIDELVTIEMADGTLITYTIDSSKNNFYKIGILLANLQDLHGNTLTLQEEESIGF